MSSRLAQI